MSTDARPSREELEAAARRLRYNLRSSDAWDLSVSSPSSQTSPLEPGLHSMLDTSLDSLIARKDCSGCHRPLPIPSSQGAERFAHARSVGDSVGLCRECAITRYEGPIVRYSTSCPNCHGTEWSALLGRAVLAGVIARQGQAILVHDVSCPNCGQSFLAEQLDLTTLSSQDGRCPRSECRSSRLRVTAYARRRPKATFDHAHFRLAYDIAECRQCLTTYRIDKPLVETLVMIKHLPHYSLLDELRAAFPRTEPEGRSPTATTIKADPEVVKALAGALALGLEKPNRQDFVLENFMYFLDATPDSGRRPFWMPPSRPPSGRVATRLARVLGIIHMPRNTIARYDFTIHRGLQLSAY